MKKNISILGLCLAVLILFITIFFSGSDTNQIQTNNRNTLLPSENLEDTVKIVCVLVQDNKLIDLENFVTHTPEIYKSKRLESLRKANVIKVDNSPEAKKRRENRFTIDPYPTFENKDELVNFAIPAIELIQEQKRKFSKLVSIRQNGIEAKVLVSFGSDLNYEILLIKENIKWKVFRFSYPDMWADTYGEEVGG